MDQGRLLSGRREIGWKKGQTICLGLNKQTGTLVDTAVYFARIYDRETVGTVLESTFRR